MQAVARQERSERLGVSRPPVFHHRVAAQNRDMVLGADAIDDGDIALVTRRVRACERELRIDQHKGHAGGAHGRDARLHRGAEQRFVDANDRVIGADLPDDELRPAGLQRVLQPLEGPCGQFAADPGVPYVEVGAYPLFQFLLEPGGIGVRGRRRANSLGRGRADRQDIERSAASLREGEGGAVGVERRNFAGTARLISAG